MVKYTVRWWELHEATVEAGDEKLAKSEALKYSQMHSTTVEHHAFEVNGKEVKRW